MPLSDVIDQALISGLVTDPTEIALYTTSPSKAGGGVEVSGVNYMRQVAAPSLWALTGPPHQATNLEVVFFPAAGAGGWGTVVSIAVHEPGSTLLFYAQMPIARPVVEGQQFAIPIGGLVLRGITA